MAVLKVYVDTETLYRLRHASELLGQEIEELAESAVSEAALAHARRHDLLDARPAPNPAPEE